MAYMERKTMQAGNHLVLEKLQSDNYKKMMKAISIMKPHIDNGSPRPPANRGGKAKALSDEGW